MLAEKIRRKKAEKDILLMTHIVVGYPTFDASLRVVEQMVEAGVDLMELQIPFSEPIADGPVILHANQASLVAGSSVEACLRFAEEVARRFEIPFLLMSYYNIVFKFGVKAFAQRMATAGLAGAIVPDLLVEESVEFSRICADQDFSLIQLVTPTTPRERQVRIAESSSGFLYYVSVTGITGERTALPVDLVDNVKWLREQTDLPICIGFGISGPETASQLAPVADGLIVGSAVVRRVHDAGATDTAEERVMDFVKTLRHAVDHAPPVI